MARPKDPMMAQVRRIRRKISRELVAAHRRGKLHEAMRALEREGTEALREAARRSKESIWESGRSMRCEDGPKEPD